MTELAVRLPGIVTREYEKVSAPRVEKQEKLVRPGLRDLDKVNIGTWVLGRLMLPVAHWMMTTPSHPRVEAIMELFFWAPTSVEMHSPFREVS